MLERGASGSRRKADVREWNFGMGRKKALIVAGQLTKRRLVPGRQRQQMQRALHGNRRRHLDGGRLFQHHVGVGAAHAEGAYPGPARALLAFPAGEGSVD